jgi:Flp pilus assembly protein TadG
MLPRLLDAVGDRLGAVLVEFAVALPVLLGVMQFRLFFYDTILATRAAAVGARQLSIIAELGIIQNGDNAAFCSGKAA